jgi:hypothetical protein
MLATGTGRHVRLVVDDFMHHRRSRICPESGRCIVFSEQGLLLELELPWEVKRHDQCIGLGVHAHSSLMSRCRDSLSIGQVLFENESMTSKAPSSAAAHSSTGEEFHMDVSYRMSTVARSVTLKRIVSGGQTGVDRGALDAALASGFECGGWVPGNRMAEDGVISDRYPLTVLPNGNYRQRTRLNVVDSDGTAIFYDGSLSGGTRLTRDLCELLSRPCNLISARETPDPIVAADAVVKFIEDNNVQTLNVAGPRASGWGAGYRFAAEVIGGVISGLPKRVPQEVLHANT